MLKLIFTSKFELCLLKYEVYIFMLEFMFMNNNNKKTALK